MQVAIDVGPTIGHRTGVGNAVAWTIESFDEPDVADQHLDLLPYVTSARAKLAPSQRRLPIPAMLAQRLWAYSSRPHMDRWLGHPDLVHGTNYVVPPTACPRLVSVYDCWFLRPEVAADHVDPDVRRAGNVLRRAVHDGAHVVTSSEATARRAAELLEIDSDHLHTVLLGPPRPSSRDATPPPTPPSEPFILALGSVERRKNLPTLVDAFGHVAARHRELRLVLAGAPGDDSAHVDSRIAALPAQVADRVVLMGAIDDAAKRWLLEHALVLAYPSLDEGFGFPLLEAQQSGVPVVASTSGSIPEIAGAGALLASATDVHQIAAQLDLIVDDESERQRLVAAGRVNLERFSWSATATKLLSVYTDVLESC